MVQEKGDPVKEVLEGDGTPKDDTLQKPEEPKEPLSPERLTQIVQGLQKGFYGTREELSEMKGSVQQIVDLINRQSGAEKGGDEYLTAGKLQEILSKQAEQEDQRRFQADAYIDTALEQLRGEGVIGESEAEEKEFLNYALKLREPDLIKVGERWNELKDAREEGRKAKEVREVKQEAGGKVGTSSRTPTGESKGVNWNKVRRMDWSDIPNEGV